MIFEIFGTINILKFLFVAGGAFYFGIFLTIALAKLFEIENTGLQLAAASIISVVIFIIGWFFIGGYAALIALANFLMILLGNIEKIERSEIRFGSHSIGGLFIVGLIDIAIISAFVYYLIGMEFLELVFCELLTLLGSLGIYFSPEDKLGNFLSDSVLCTLAIIFGLSIYYSGDYFAMGVTGLFILIIVLAATFMNVEGKLGRAICLGVAAVIGFLSVCLLLHKSLGNISILSWALPYVDMFFPIILIAGTVALILSFICARDAFGVTFGFYGITIVILLITNIYSISSEAQIAAKYIGEQMSERLSVFRQYVEFYRAIQNDPRLRARYLAGMYEIPEKQGIAGPALELKSSVKNVYVNRIDIDNDYVSLEIYGCIENPFEHGVKIKNISVNITLNTIEVEGGPHEAHKVVECTIGGKPAPRDIEPLGKYTFYCKSDISINITNNTTAIAYLVKPIVEYEMITAANIVLRFVSREEYDNYMKWKEPLKLEPLSSVSTIGPLKGVIYVGYTGIGEPGYNPIPVEDETNVTLEFYATKKPGIMGNISKMYCYLMIFPDKKGVKIFLNESLEDDYGTIFFANTSESIVGGSSTISPGGAKGNIFIMGYSPIFRGKTSFAEYSTVSDVIKKCVNIKRKDAEYYGYPIYYDSSFPEGLILIVYKYNETYVDKYDPLKLSDMERFVVLLNVHKDALIDGRELLYPITAYYHYDFKSYGEEKSAEVSLT